MANTAKRVRLGNITNSFKIDLSSIVSDTKGRKFKSAAKNLERDVRKIITENINDDAEDVYDTIGDNIGSQMLDIKGRILKRYKGNDVPKDGYWRGAPRNLTGRRVSGTPVITTVRRSRAKLGGFDKSKSLPLTSLTTRLKDIRVGPKPGGAARGTEYPNATKSEEIKSIGDGKSVNISSIIETGTRFMRSVGQSYTTLSGERFNNSTGYHIHDRIVKDELKIFRERFVTGLNEDVKRALNS